MVAVLDRERRTAMGSLVGANLKLNKARKKSKRFVSIPLICS
jgi:hypothetical protein